MKKTINNKIGSRDRKIDGAEKATGSAKFADDIMFADMLHVKIKRSTRAHAKILNIDTLAAEKLQGVVKIITGKDIPVKYGVIPWTKDEYPICLDKVRYIGDPVAAVAAVDEETATIAIKLIKVSYENLEPIVDIKTAAEGGDDEKTKVNEKARTKNITKRVCLEFGDVEKELKDSDIVIKNRFYFSNNTHAAIEPHCAIANYDKGNLLTLISSTQVPHYLHKALSEVLNIKENLIRVIKPEIGGAFGGKSEPLNLEFIVAKLAMDTGKTVKCLYSREEVFYSHRGRHPMSMEFECGASMLGEIKAISSKIEIDGGAYASFGMITTYYAGQLLTGPTNSKAYRFDATRYYTNKPACGPKRGHGSVQPRFALEVQLDMIAQKLKIDPIKLRKINAIKDNEETINSQKIGSFGIIECLDLVEEKSGWKKKKGKLPFGRGIGVATSMYISGTNYPIYPNNMPQSSVQVKLDRSGRAVVFSGSSDIGQGSNSLLATLTSEELGISIDSIKVVSGDTDLTPVDLGSYSSRVTLMAGFAAKEALKKIKEKIQISTSDHWNNENRAICAMPCEIMIEDRKVWFSRDTGLNISLEKAISIAEERFGALISTGNYITKTRGGSYQGGSIGASPAYSCTAHIAEVTVSERTGIVEVNKIWVAHDCGKAINPMLVEGQIEGSTYMGCGEAMHEEIVFCKKNKGLILNPSLLEYKVPTSLDTPDIFSHIIEKKDPNGPYGAKEAGEGPIHGSIPAISNAIYDAVGIRVLELPFAPHKILNLIKESKNATHT